MLEVCSGSRIVPLLLVAAAAVFGCRAAAPLAEAPPETVASPQAPEEPRDELYDPGVDVTENSSAWHMEIAIGGSPDAVLLHVDGHEEPYDLEPTDWGTWKVAPGDDPFPIPAGHFIRLMVHDNKRDLAAEYGWVRYMVDPSPPLGHSPLRDGDEDQEPKAPAADTADVADQEAPTPPDSTAEDASPRPRGPRLLFIGNSFTHMGPVPDCFRDLAVDAGHPAPDVRAVTGSGATLAQHREDTWGTLRAVDEGDWDVVVLQDHSLRPTDAAGDPAAFKADVDWFGERVRESSPDAVIVLFQTWARHPDSDVYPEPFADFEQMQDQLRTHYLESARKSVEAGSDVVVAPVGDVFAHLLQEEGAIPILDAHGYHASPLGQYLAALVLYKTIYDDPETVGRTNQCGWYTGSTLCPESIEILQRLADEAMGELRAPSEAEPRSPSHQGSRRPSSRQSPASAA